LLGLLAIGIAMSLEQVLSLMLYSYAFMVSGLLIPLIAAVFFKNRNQTAAMYAMVLGGLTTVLLTAIGIELPLSLDANVFGISVSGIVFLLINLKSKEYDYEN
jgi:SSS family solute:Na+ symporter